ncbi:MAG: periplasmic heavy metal sensor [bacterium]|nr:periplasmic heavy metal sensor [bacterium]
MSWLRSRWVWLLLIGSLAFNAGMGTTFGVRAYSRHCERPCGSRQRGHEAFLEQLGLDVDQRAEVKADGDRLHAQMRELHQTLAEESATLASLLVSVEPDRSLIDAQLDRLTELHRQKQVQTVEHFLRFSQLLNDDQRAVFEQKLRRMFSRGGPGHRGFGRHHKFRGRGGAHRKDLPDRDRDWVEEELQENE